MIKKESKKKIEIAKDLNKGFLIRIFNNFNNTIINVTDFSGNTIF